MGNRKTSDAASSQTPIAPKRKRQVSCLDEQERRERKRAMDREAQRSLREKTKTRIADLERTIEMLQKKDGNSAAASLVAEIDALRAENERLRQVIDNVRCLVGGGVTLRNSVAGKGEGAEKDEDSSSTATHTAGPGFPELLTPFVTHDARANPFVDANQPSSTEQATSAEQRVCMEPPTSIVQSTFFDHPIITGPIDIDGMNLMTGTQGLGFADANEDADIGLELQPPTESVQEEEEKDPSVKIQRETTYMAMLQEIFGPISRTPSPIIIHIGNPAKVPQPPPGAPACAMWVKISEVLNRIYTYRSHAINGSLSTRRTESNHPEAGLLYLAIKNGWDSIPAFEWQHYPALELFKQVDDLAFHRLQRTVRLAVGYKCLKLFKYYLNASKQDLDNVPVWLRPSSFQASTKHPIIIDIFAWPTLRSRFLTHHQLLSRSAALSFHYLSCLRFDWPFAFDDTFFHDDASGSYQPSPLFEMYANDLKHWMMEERFYENFPEMKGDIEGDRMSYAQVEVFG